MELEKIISTPQSRSLRRWAQHAIQSHPVLGHLFGDPIAGHQSGLLDGLTNQACQAKRLQNSDLPDWENAPAEILFQTVPPLPPFLQKDQFTIEIWDMAHVTPARFADKDVSRDMAKSFRDLIKLGGGFWAWPELVGQEGNREIFVPLAEWQKVLGKRKP